jgi:hypothetical protein
VDSALTIFIQNQTHSKIKRFVCEAILVIGYEIPSTFRSTTQVCKLGYGGYGRDLVAFTPSLAASPFDPTASSIPGLRFHMMLLFYLASFFPSFSFQFQQHIAFFLRN